MAKAKKTRFGWNRNASLGTAEKIDRVTEETILIKGREFPEEIQDEIFVYGISKITDDRQSQVPADHKMEGIPALVAQFMEGMWKAERTGGARFLPTVVEAIAQIKGCSIASAQAAYRGLDDEQKVVLKTNLADTILEIEEARKDADIPELDDMLS